MTRSAELPESVGSPVSAELPLLADYAGGWLGAVLPGAAAALGEDVGLPGVELPRAKKVCVVLVDGLGEHQLAASSQHAEFLCGLERRILRAGAPTTTATSMGSFGTGLPPGTHGLAGYSVLDPDRGELLNELKWHPDTDPLAWQPEQTVLERLSALGRRTVSIGNPEFAGSGLTLAAHRGAEFIGVRRLHKRVATAAAALTADDGPDLVYLYWGEVDAAGHRRGWQSSQWRRSVRHVDRELRRLAAALPQGTLLLVTSDHGMVDTAAVDRVDLADHPELTEGIQLIGGEPRMVQLYTEPGAAPEVAARLTAALGDRAWVRLREDADDWFGTIEERTRGRFGNVVVAARRLFTLVDSASMSAAELGLVGYHGSLTAAEQEIPLAIHLV